MHLQGICDAQMQFLDVYCGWPGSVHDARVFKNSPAQRKMQSGVIAPKYHILGDSAYALQLNVMTPFRDNGHLNDIQKKYNKLHSSTRSVVERAFGLLKGKFRRLKYLDMVLLKDIPKVITTACALHNFILKNENDIGDIEMEDNHDNCMPEDPAVVDQNKGAAVNKRSEIATHL